MNFFSNFITKFSIFKRDNLNRRKSLWSELYKGRKFYIIDDIILSNISKIERNDFLIDNKKKINKKAKDILEELNIEYSYISYNRAPDTIEEKLKVDESINVKGIKNLLFRTNSKRYFFIITYRDSRFDTKEFREKHNIPKIHLVNDDELKELIDSESGRVSILDLINDKENKISVYIDNEILNSEYFRFHPFNKLITVKIKTKDLLGPLMKKLNHEINII